MPNPVPHDEQEALFRRILTSRQFAHADNLKRILQFLVECSREEGRDSPKEYEIAVRALGRPEHFDARTDPIVRVSLASIRDRLLAYFATEGEASPWRVEVPKGNYRLRFVLRSGDSPAAAAARATAEFWRPYLESPLPGIIVYTEPLFFRDNTGRFVRDWGVNRIDEQPRVVDSFPDAEPGAIEPVYHYLSSGEMHCLLSLTRMFHEAGVPVETRNCRSSHWNELSRSNLILLGSPRTNPFIRQLQGESVLLTRERHIERRLEGANEPQILAGRRFQDGNLQRMTEYAVVTRRPGVVDGSAVTMIAANHGRAIEGAGHTLTLDDRVDGLLARIRGGAGAAVPAYFQLLFRVETIDVDDEVTAVTCDEVVLTTPNGG